MFYPTSPKHIISHATVPLTPKITPLPRMPLRYLPPYRRAVRMLAGVVMLRGPGKTAALQVYWLVLHCFSLKRVLSIT